MSVSLLLSVLDFSVVGRGGLLSEQNVIVLKFWDEYVWEEGTAVLSERVISVLPIVLLSPASWLAVVSSVV
jgi:hypothetical protein